MALTWGKEAQLGQFPGCWTVTFTVRLISLSTARPQTTKSSSPKGTHIIKAQKSHPLPEVNYEWTSRNCEKSWQHDEHQKSWGLYTVPEGCLFWNAWYLCGHHFAELEPRDSRTFPSSGWHEDSAIVSDPGPCTCSEVCWRHKAGLKKQMINLLGDSLSL